MKKLGLLMLGIMVIATSIVSCKDEESYAEQKEKERKVINAFLERDPLLLVSKDGDTLLNTRKINPISLEQFEAQDSMTDVSKNEYVLFKNSGIYMQIVRQGTGEKMKSGESKRIITRYWEYNILADSLQSTDMVPYWSTNPGVMDVNCNSGTFTATWNVTEYSSGAMYQIYGTSSSSATSVPNGWIVPLSYIKVGRQTNPDEGIALVRMIVPHSQGTETAKNAVYPCFYEISYQETRGNVKPKSSDQ